MGQQQEVEDKPLVAGDKLPEAKLEVGVMA